jgi:hypothetical protein
MRAVNVNPGDGERAIAEMRAAGAEIVKGQGQEAEKQGQEAGAGGR